MPLRPPPTDPNGRVRSVRREPWRDASGTPPDLRSKVVLTEKQVGELAKLGKQLHEKYDIHDVSYMQSCYTCHR